MNAFLLYPVSRVWDSLGLSSLSCWSKATLALSGLGSESSGLCSAARGGGEGGGEGEEEEEKGEKGERGEGGEEGLFRWLVAVCSYSCVQTAIVICPLWF